MKTAEDKRTKLQKKFEEQTPTIKSSLKPMNLAHQVEYLQTYCTWLELQVEKRESYAKQHAIEFIRWHYTVSGSSLTETFAGDLYTEFLNNKQ